MATDAKVLRTLTSEQRARLGMATQLVKDFNDEHGLSVTVRAHPGINRARGQYHYSKKEIRIATWLLATSDAEVEKTVRHEYAHALAGPGSGHGQPWIDMCKVTGAVPEAQTRGVRPEYKWVAICPVHGQLNGGWYGKPNMGKIHRACGEYVDIVPAANAAKIRWEE